MRETSIPTLARTLAGTLPPSLVDVLMLKCDVTDLDTRGVVAEVTGVVHLSWEFPIMEECNVGACEALRCPEVDSVCLQQAHVLEPHVDLLTLVGRPSANEAPRLRLEGPFEEPVVHVCNDGDWTVHQSKRYLNVFDILS